MTHRIGGLLAAVNPLGTRIRPPWDLAPVTTVGAEVPAAELGLSRRRVEAVWTAVRAFYRTGLQPGLALVVRHRDQVLLDRAIGHARLDGGALMTTSTPACLFSGSKAITAVLIHRLVEDGVLGLDDRVADHIGEFAANGKQDVTLRGLLTHRAGLARLPVAVTDPDVLFDTDAMLRALYAAPLRNERRQGYHAITSGYLLGEVARRASGRPITELLDRYLAGPLGCRSMSYGVPEHRRGQVALSYSTGPASLPPITTLLERLLGLPGHLIAPRMNSDLGMSSVLPAAGLYASAHDAARVYQALADGGSTDGVRILRASTLAEAVRPAGPLVIDASLPAPIRFSAGFMLGERVASLFGVNTPHAFGHLGFTNVVTWADPSRALSVAFLNTGKAAAPEGFAAMLAVTSAISAAVPPVAGRAGRVLRR